MSHLQPHDLANLIYDYHYWCRVNSQEPTMLGLAHWIEDNDTNTNLHTYRRREYGYDEKPDAFDESNDPKDYRGEDHA